MPNQNFKITNLTCQACIKLSTKALEEIPGVIKVTIDLSTGLVEMVVEHEIVWAEIVKILREIGKEAVQLN
jgi:copper chaperone CopZ